MLLGEYRLSLDRAGRFSLPVGIRHALHELYTPEDTTLIGTTFYDRCLVYYPRAEWLSAKETLHRKGACPALIRCFRYRAALCPLDRQGRVYVPPQFRQYAAIDRDVLLIGLVKLLELWSPQQWEAYAADEVW